jgi:hypothetical protein
MRISVVTFVHVTEVLSMFSHNLRHYIWTCGLAIYVLMTRVIIILLKADNGGESRH